MAEKPVKTKQPELKNRSELSKAPIKAETAKTPVKAKKDDKEKSLPKQPNRIVKWYRETIGELRKVTWPTPKEAWQLTKVVLVVMLATSVLLGSLDFIFSKLIGLLASI